MSYGTTFDDFEYDGSTDLKPLKPIWEVDLDNEDELLKWLDKDFQNRQYIMEPKLRTQNENLALYKGIHYRSQETRSNDFRRNEGERSTRNPKIVVNHVYDMVETKTAKLNRFKPAISVIPNNNEWEDKINAKVGKKLIDARWRAVNIDAIIRDLQRACFINGEAYIHPYWNKDIGPKLPIFEELKEKGIEVEKIDIETGEVVHDEDGNPVKLKQSIRVGDVDYEIVIPRYLYPDNVDEWRDVKSLDHLKYIAVQELKAMFPDKEDKIHPHKGLKWDSESLSSKHCSNEALLHRLYFKPQPFLPNGLVIHWCQDCILKIEKVYPLDHGEFPFIRLTDIDVTNELHSRSFIQVIRQLQRHYNNLASGIARNHGLASAPKWILPKGACKISSLDNEATVVEYRGGVPPRLEAPSPTSPEIFQYMNKLEEMISQKSGVHGISQGTPPPGIRAGVALQFLDEQEMERESNAISKRHNAIRDCAKQTLALMGQYYESEDGRTIQILGKDNSYALKEFEKTDFANGYDVIIQNSSALPDSKAGKIQSIIDLSQAFPNMFVKEQVVDMLDLAASDKFKDMASAAVNAAESENDDMLGGYPVAEPKNWEDLLIHYRIHMTCLQERQFKEEVPTESRINLQEHIMATEYLMAERAKVNPLFAQKLMMLDQYPVFYKPEPQAALPPMGGAAPEGDMGGMSAPPAGSGSTPIPDAMPTQTPINEQL